MTPLKARLEPFSVEYMVRCEPLPKLLPQTRAELDLQAEKDDAQYVDCMKRHNGLVKQIEDRLIQ